MFLVDPSRNIARVPAFLDLSEGELEEVRLVARPGTHVSVETEPSGVPVDFSVLDSSGFPVCNVRQAYSTGEAIRFDLLPGEYTIRVGASLRRSN